MPGPQPKPASKRQRANKPKDAAIVLALVRGIEPPAAPEGLLQKIEEDWEAFWKAPLAQHVIQEDLPALKRLFTLYDERERAYRSYRANRLVKGSQDQMVLNPLARVMQNLDVEIRHLEDRFGLTPRARFALGIAFGEVTKSLEEMNRTLAANDDNDQEATEEEDPRTIEA